ncbi:sensor histidine kinase [Longimicrobium sp.]|uniref:sensor histidine kinase n=1 Tax=Longimicrobium sp. TaxID=2029185 RepID=UPI002ED942E7
MRTAAPGRIPARRTWLPAFAAAAAFGLLDALPEFGGSGGREGALAVARELLPWLGWAVLAPAVVAVAERVPLGRPPLARGIALHLAAGTLLSVVKLAMLLPVSHFLFGWSGQGTGLGEGLAWLLAHRLPGNVIMYLLFAAGATVLIEQRLAREQETSRARLAAELAESELRLLRAQLEPHFLFNALNTVAAFVRIDPPRAERMLSELGELLRLVLRASSAADVTLDEELTIVARYAEIQRMRFGDGFRLRTEADPETRSLRVPGILLQPLVENAVRYSGAGEVLVRARREHGMLVLSVANVASAPAAAGNGDGSGEAIGLANTRARLHRIYGGAATVTLREAGGHTVAEIRLPIAGSRTPAAG